MDEVVPGITENVRIDDSADIPSSAAETREPADPRAASIEPVPEITYDEQLYPGPPAPAASARSAAPQQRPPGDDRPAHGDGDQPLLRGVAGAPGDAQGRRCAQPAALRPAHHVAQSLRPPGCSTRHQHRRRVVHRVSDLAHHAAGGVVPRRPRARRSSGTRSSASESTRCTPVRSSEPAESWAGARRPSVDGHFDRISTQIDPLFGDEEEFRRLTMSRTRMAAASSTTSCPATPARALTSGWPRWRSRTTRGSIT